MTEEQVVELLIESYIEGYNTAKKTLDALKLDKDDLIEMYKNRLERPVYEIRRK